MKLGELIKTYRKVNKLSLRYIANEINISAPTLVDIEGGAGMTIYTFRKIFMWLTR